MKYAYLGNREGVLPFALSLAEGVVLMRTYEEFNENDIPFSDTELDIL